MAQVDSSLLLEVEGLVPQVCRAHHALAHTLFHEAGLYKGQPGILSLLWEADGRTQTEIGDALHIQPATVTKMISRMESTGFIERRADPDDQRVSRIFLTEAGKNVRPQVQLHLQMLADKMLAGFTEEELVLMRRFLLQLRDNLREAHDKDG